MRVLEWREIFYLAQIYILFKSVPLVVIAQILYQVHDAKTLFCVWCWCTNTVLALRNERYSLKTKTKKRVFLATVCTTPFLSQQYVAHQVEFNEGQDPWNIHFSITRDVLLMHFCCCSVAAVCTVLWNEQCIPLYAMKRSMELILRC